MANEVVKVTEVVNTISASISDGSYNLLAGGTIGGPLQLNSTLTVGVDDTGYDVKFFGDATSKFMHWDASADELKLPDSTKLTFGADDDLKIYHDSLHSYIADTGTGDLRLRADTLRLQSTSGEQMAVLSQNSSVALYFNDSKKFETSNTGATISGKLVVNGDLEVSTSGTITHFQSTTTQIDDPVLRLGENAANDNFDRGVEFLYNDGSAKVGFFGYSDSLEAFTFLTAATNNSEVFTGIAGTLHVGSVLHEAGSAGTPAISFSSDTNTGFYYAGTDSIGISTNGTYRAKFTSSGLFETWAGIQLKGGVIRTTDGDASAPSYSFEGDTNTGIFGGTDIIGFSTGGTEVARFDSSGKLGLGCTPTANLDITTSLNQQHLYIQGALDSGSTALARLKTISNGNVLLLESATTSDSREIFDVKNSNGTVFKIQGDGASVFSGAVTVGANTDGHDVKLFGNSDGFYIEWDESTNYLTGVYNQRISSDRELQFGTSANHLRLYHYSGASWIKAHSSTLNIWNETVDADIVFKVTDSSSVNEIMRLDGSARLVDIAGNLRLKGGTNQRLQITNDSNNNWGEIGNDGASGENTLEFFTGSSSTPAMSITNGNLVGIGTTSPSTLLDVYNGAGWGGLDLDGTAGGELRFQKAGTTYLDIYASDNGSTGSIIKATDHLHLSSGNGTTAATSLFLKNDGKVGIGTLSPSHPLHLVAADGAISGDWLCRFTNLEATAGQNFGLKIDAGVAAGCIPFTIVNLAGTELIKVNGLGATTFGGSITVGVDDTGHDVKFFGATSGRYMLWDESTNSLNLTDTTGLYLGDAQDLQIYHSTNSYIENTTGHLYIKNNTPDSLLRFQADNGAGGTTTYFQLSGSQATHDGSATTMLMTHWFDNSRISLGDGFDIQIWHDGTNSKIYNGGGDFTIDQAASSKDLILKAASGEIKLQISGTDAFRIDSSGDLHMKSGQKLHTYAGGINWINYNNFQASSGSALTINNAGSGGVNLQTGGSTRLSIGSNGTTTFLGQVTVGADTDGHDVKFFGNSTGKYMEWDESADRLILPDDTNIQIGNDQDLLIANSGTNSTLTQNTGNLIVSTYGGNLMFQTQHTNGTDIIFQTKYSSTTTELMRMDGSASSVNIPDDVKLKIGSGGDLQLQHSSDHSYIENSTGHLYINNHGENKMVYFRADDGTGSDITEYFRVDGSANQVIYSQPVTLIDDKKLNIGTDNDLQIYHSGTTSYIKSTSDDLRLTNASNDNIFRVNGDVAELYYNDSKRFETTSAGATVTGSLTISSDLIISGTTTTIDTANLLVEDKNIILGNVSTPSDTTADGGGITLKGVTDHTINWTNSTDSWHFNQGITVGANFSELVTNGGFDADSNWTKQAGWSIGSGVASSDGSQSSNAEIYQINTVTVGKTYTLTYTVTARSAGQVRVKCGYTAGTYRNATGTYSEVLTATTVRNVSFDADADFVGSVDNVSVYEASHDVKFHGATAGKYMHWDESADRLKLPDNTGLAIGSADDLLISHDGNYSYITEQGQHDLYIQPNSSSLYVRDGVSGMVMLACKSGSGKVVELYGNNVKRLSTDSGGVGMFGTLTVGADTDGHDVKFFGAASGSYMLWDEDANALHFPDVSYLYMGNGADLRMYHNGSDSHIDNYTGNLNIVNNTNNGLVQLYCDDGSNGVTPYITLDGDAEKVTFSKLLDINSGTQTQSGSNGIATIQSTATTTATSTQSSGMYKIQNYLNLTGTGGSFQNASHQQLQTTVSSTGTATQLKNHLSRVHTTGSGQIQNVSHYNVQAELGGNGTINNWMGYAVADGALTAFENTGHTITNTYGLYIGDLTSGTQTNTPFGVYQASTDMQNYFGSKVGIGTATPSHLLHVKDGDIYSQNGHIHVTQGNYIKNASNGAQRHGFPSDAVYAFEGVSVGIGTTTSGSILEIQGDGGNDKQLRLASGSSSTYWDIGRNYNTGHFEITEDSGDTYFLIDKDNGKVAISGGVKISGGVEHNVTGISNVNYTVEATDYIVHYATLTGSGKTVTLPTAQCTEGRVLIIKDGAGTAGQGYSITIATEGSENIDGAATKVISSNYGSVTLYADHLGANWFTI